MEVLSIQYLSKDLPIQVLNHRIRSFVKFLYDRYETVGHLSDLLTLPHRS